MAYVDETGDTGSLAKKGASQTFGLGCVLIDAAAWPAAFDELLQFRRRLRLKFGIPMRAEIKATYLIRGSGDLAPLALGPGARQLIFRSHMRVLRDLPAQAFAIVTPKDRHPDLTAAALFEMTWEALLQRLEKASGEQTEPFAIYHDDGADAAVRRAARRARRHLTAGSIEGSGSLRAPARLLVDDPVARKSSESYCVQLADLVAYAAFRSVIQPSDAVARVCPQDMWDEIGPATRTIVNARRPRAAPGIVLR
jgi:hypothetical protein